MVGMGTKEGMWAIMSYNYYFDDDGDNGCVDDNDDDDGEKRENSIFIKKDIK